MDIFKPFSTRPKFIPMLCPVCRGHKTVNWGKEICAVCKGEGFLKVPPIEEGEVSHDKPNN